MATRTATASTSSPRLRTTSIPTPTSATSSSKVLTTTPTSLSTLWWNTNLPPAEQTPVCPSYLIYATHHQKERSNLATPDALFTRKTWPEVRSLIAANRLDQFTRVPSELRQYRKWTEGIVREYGSMMRFVLEERLGWKEGGEIGLEGRFGEKGTPVYSVFIVYLDEWLLTIPPTSTANWKILRNDWPYGLDTRIVHLVVWTKFSFPSDPLTDDLVPASRAEIEGFVRQTFSRVCGEKNVVWFRNWGELKSVRAIEHFHVLIFEPPVGFVERVTGGLT
jgi:hypothetical protein